ncbi:hypothetical protein PVAP13_J683277 [Panicum virgatum]|nr:hypothetical protein PVAP13_J683277 [Panicum virgatum]
MMFRFLISNGFKHLHHKLLDIKFLGHMNPYSYFKMILYWCYHHRKTRLDKAVFPEPPSPIMETILIICWLFLSTSLDIISCFSRSLPHIIDATATFGTVGVALAVLFMCGTG